MSNVDFLFVYEPMSFYKDCQIFKNEKEVIKYMKNEHSGDFYKVNKKDFIKLYKSAIESYIEKPFRFALYRLKFKNEVIKY